MKVNAPISAAIRSALGLVGAEWEPELVQSVQPVVVLASDAASSVGTGSSSSTSGNAMWMEAIQIAVAASYSHVQLLNPAGSGVDVHIDAVDVMNLGAAATQVHLRWYDTALGFAVNHGSPKREAGAFTGAARLYTQALGGTLGGRRAIGFAAAAGGLMRWEFRDPYVLEPGRGALVHLFTVNQEMVATWHWREITRSS